MRNYFAGVMLLIVVALTCRPAKSAQSAEQSGSAKAPPDLSGIWAPGGETGISPFAAAEAGARDLAAGRIPIFGFSREEPPMQPWAAERYKANRAGMRPSERGTEAADPIMYPYCTPHGIPRVYTIPTSFEIVQAPGRVYMLFEGNHQVRRVYTDGKKHLEGWSPTFMGNSTGKWDGDTLVVETDNILSLDGYSWMDTFGHVYSDALHVTERIQRVNHDTLQIDFLFDDPKAYTKPWTGKKMFRLDTAMDMTEQILCEDHQKEDFLRDVHNGKGAGRP